MVWFLLLIININQYNNSYALEKSSVETLTDKYAIILETLEGQTVRQVQNSISNTEDLVIIKETLITLSSRPKLRRLFSTVEYTKKSLPDKFIEATEPLNSGLIFLDNEAFSYHPESSSWKEIAPTHVWGLHEAYLDNISILHSMPLNNELKFLKDRYVNLTSAGVMDKAMMVYNDIEKIESLIQSRNSFTTGVSVTKKMSCDVDEETGLIKNIEITDSDGNVVFKLKNELITNKEVSLTRPPNDRLSSPEDEERIKKIKLLNNTPVNELAEKGKAGFAIALVDKKILVSAVAPNSAASRSGVISGDEILGINSVSVDGMNIEEFVRLTKTSHQLVLKIKRDGLLKNIKISKTPY